MNIQVESRLTEYYKSIDALTNLTALEHPTSTQRAQMSGYMAIISGLKDGATREQVRSWDEERFRKELGLPSNASLRCDPDENKLWRDFVLGGHSRGATLPVEFRDNEGGGQALTYGAGALGGTWVDFTKI
jgi:hypothetical protein